MSKTRDPGSQLRTRGRNSGQPPSCDEFVVVAAGSDEDEAKFLVAALRAARILVLRDNCSVLSAPLAIPAFPVVTWLLSVRLSEEVSAGAVIQKSRRW
jgi:hypothetical protein